MMFFFKVPKYIKKTFMNVFILLKVIFYADCSSKKISCYLSVLSKHLHYLLHLHKIKEIPETLMLSETVGY